MADVAALAGVSKSTVSAVVNGKDIVQEGTRRRVLRAIDELRYRPRNASTHPEARSGKCIGFVIKEAENPYYAEVLSGIQEVARGAGYLVFTSSSEGDYEAEKRIVETFTARHFDGLVITPILDGEADLSHIFDLKRMGVPLVLLESVRGIRACLVDTDNVSASAHAVKHLIDLGHAHIAHFAGPSYSQHSQERVEGVRRAFSESHLIFNSETMVVPAGDSIEEGYRAGLAYFSQRADARPTGLTCYNDLVAFGLLKALHELELRVPEDVSVVGFDDLEMIEYLPLPLTTVRVPKREMGRRAATLLLQQIDAKQPQPPERIQLEAELVVRGSTAPVSRKLVAETADDGAAAGTDAGM